MNGPILADAMLHVVDQPPEPKGTAQTASPATPTVLLVHGTMDRSTSFGRVVGRLTDLHVVTYDRRGYGRSRADGAAGDVATHVDDLLAVIGERRVAAVGHSLGGNLVLAAASRRPDIVVSAGTYEAPLPWIDEWPRGTAGGQATAPGVDPADAAEAFMRRMVGDERWNRLPAATRAQRRAEGAALVAEIRSLQTTAPYDPASVRVPVVVGRGSESAAHHRLSTAWLLERLPDAEAMVIDGAGHGAHLSHPEPFAALVRRVVARAG